MVWGPATESRDAPDPPLVRGRGPAVEVGVSRCASVYRDLGDAAVGGQRADDLDPRAVEGKQHRGTHRGAGIASARKIRAGVGGPGARPGEAGVGLLVARGGLQQLSGHVEGVYVGVAADGGGVAPPRGGHGDGVRAVGQAGHAPDPLLVCGRRSVEVDKRQPLPRRPRPRPCRRSGPRADESEVGAVESNQHGGRRDAGGIGAAGERRAATRWPRGRRR